MVSFSSLTSDIQSQVQIIDTYLAEHELPQPSFAPDSPTELPLDANVQRARLKLIEAASALANLAIGSADHLRWQCFCDKFDDTAFHFLATYNVFDAVPRDGSISYSELSKKCGLSEHRLRRCLSMVYTLHYFCEPKPGYVAHTSNSAIAIGDPLARAWILHNVEEVQPWYANKLVDAYKKWGDSTNPLHSGPNLNAKPGEEKNFFEIMQEDGDGEWNGVAGKGFRLWRLWDTDKFFATGGAIKGTNLLRTYDWAKLGKATVVNIGGNYGHIASAVALAHPDLTFIVQERPSPGHEKVFYAQLPPELKGRVSLMECERFGEQKIKGAEVYFISTELHKEPDETAILLLRRIVDAMDPKKSRLIVREIILDGGDPPPEDAVINGQAINPEEGVYEAGLGPTGVITRLNVGVDFQVLSTVNAFERNRKEWINLFNKADPRFVMKSCIQTVGSCTALMEWVLE